MKAAIAALGHDPKSLDIVLIQMVRLVENGQEVKMSKRTGNAVTSASCAKTLATTPRAISL